MESHDAEFGEIVRKTREYKSLSIEDVCLKLKVNSRYIKAIEEGNIFNIVAKVYATAYLKAYSDLLGLSVPEEIRSHPAQQDNNYISPVFNDTMERKQSKSLAVTSLFVLVVIYGILFLYHKNSNKNQIREQIVKSALLSIRDVENVKMSASNFSVNQVFKDIFGSNNSTVLIASEKTALKIYDPSSKLLTNKIMEVGDTLFLNKEEGLIITADNDKGVEVFEENDLKPLHDLYTHKLKDKFYIKSARYIPVSKE
ncbi:MAG: helix-turn-helix domain-containing protein [Alphaproteobacteria bacterium]|nr:helix-turn-helix domain-containing protein [Alphaproteobacteria bacterium]